MDNRKLNRENYEATAISYLDGTLNPLEVAGFLLFLEQNPDIAEEVASLQQLAPEIAVDINFPFKDAMKQEFDTEAKQISQENINYYFVAYFENDLSETGKRNGEFFIRRHPEFEREFDQFRHSRVVADEFIKFEHRETLKKKIPVVFWQNAFRITAIAASVLILVSVYLRLEPESADSLKQNIGEKELPVINKPLVKQTQQPNIIPEKVSKARQIQKRSNVTDKQRTQPKTKELRSPSNSIDPLPSRTLNINSGVPFAANTRTFYIDLYDDIKLSQEIMMANLETEETDPENAGTTGLAGRRFNEIIRSGVQIAKQMPESLNGWMIADLGLQGFNVLTDNNLKIQRRMNAEGKTEDVRLMDDGETAYSLRKKN